MQIVNTSGQEATIIAERLREELDIKGYATGTGNLFNGFEPLYVQMNFSSTIDGGSFEVNYFLRTDPPREYLPSDELDELTASYERAKAIMHGLLEQYTGIRE